MTPIEQSMEANRRRRTQLLQAQQKAPKRPQRDLFYGYVQYSIATLVYLPWSVTVVPTP